MRSVYVDSIYGRKPQQYITCQGPCQLRPVANKTSTSFCVQNLVNSIPEGKEERLKSADPLQAMRERCAAELEVELEPDTS